MEISPDLGRTGTISPPNCLGGGRFIFKRIRVKYAVILAPQTIIAFAVKIAAPIGTGILPVFVFVPVLLGIRRFVKEMEAVRAGFQTHSLQSHLVKYQQTPSILGLELYLLSAHLTSLPKGRANLSVVYSAENRKTIYHQVTNDPGNFAR